ncbi:MAG: preprotein translocase subunit SecD [Bradyrhizobium sp.]
MNTRASMTALAVAFLFGSAVWPATAASDDAQKIDKMRAAIAAKAETAIEKQGGSRLLFKVDADALRDVMVTGLRDDLYRIVREGRIPFSGLTIHDGGVDVRIADPKNRQLVVSKLMPSSGSTLPRASTISVADGGDGLMRLTPTDAGFAERLSELVGQSLEMIEQGLRSSHTPAGLQPDGSDRIRVLLPGVTDPERVAADFSRRAHVAFRMVDVSMSAEEAPKAPPAGSEVLHDFKTNAPYLLLKEIAIEGDDIVDASPGFLPNGDQPIASFRFNAHGARRFAEITAANIGRAFAVVVDDRVLSVAVIREPILGGSGQISGNFTLEDANIVAMLLRSGTLPGRLSIVDQQVVQPAGTAAK